METVPLYNRTELMYHASNNGSYPVRCSQKASYVYIQIKIDKDNVDIDEQDINGNTALMYAIYYNNIDIVKLLLDNNCDITIKNNVQNNALMIASKYKMIEIVELMEQKTEERIKKLNRIKYAKKSKRS